MAKEKNPYQAIVKILALLSAMIIPALSVYYVQKTNAQEKANARQNEYRQELQEAKENAYFRGCMSHVWAEAETDINKSLAFTNPSEYKNLLDLCLSSSKSNNQ